MAQIHKEDVYNTDGKHFIFSKRYRLLSLLTREVTNFRFKGLVLETDILQDMSI